MRNRTVSPDGLRERLAAEQLHTHYRQLPAVILAPALGGLFTAWVLWDAVNTRYLALGLGGVLSISALRILLYRRYRSQDPQRPLSAGWRYFAVGTAAVSGCIWGSAAIFLYPPLQPEYEVYMLVLLALIPVAPVAALAVYMPAFYAYYIPCILPFIVTLGLQDQRAERMTALLLVMMMGATLTFAGRYSAMLAEAIRLRLQLGDRKAALEEAMVVKSRFLAAASHDLRQPVHAMGLFIESLRGRIQAPESRQLLYRIEESVTSLRRMLNAMLDISRLDADIVKPRRQHFRLNPLLQKLYREYALLAGQKGLRMGFVDCSLVVDSDPALLERILRNLLDNALKYTSRGGILLGCRRHGQQLRVLVCDTGAGIPEARRDEIFHEFTQLHNPERNPDHGLGLGLSIVKRLAGLLQHELQVVSRPGRGTCFCLTLPRGDARRLHSVPTPQPSADRPQCHAHLRILVIDDDAAVRAGMATLLESWKFEVTTVATLEAALEVIRGRIPRPDLVIVDYRLSQGVTAPGVIRRLEAELGAAARFIIITGDTAPERIREAHRAGHLLLHKPVRPERLRACISALADPAGQAAAP